MREVELLGAKVITHAQAVKIGISASQSGGSFSFRAAFDTNVFTYLYEPLHGASAPRGNIIGSGEEGLFVSLSQNGRATLQNNRTSVAIRVATSFLNVAQNKIPQQVIDAIMIEFEDGDRGIVTPPLPLAFMSSKTREKYKSKELRALRVYENAFEVAYGRSFREVQDQLSVLTTSEKRVEPKAQPEPVQASVGVVEPRHEVIAAGLVPTSSSAPKFVGDLKELIAMINDQVTEAGKEPGAQIVLRVEDGRLRASVQVIFQQDL